MERTNPSPPSPSPPHLPPLFPTRTHTHANVYLPPPVTDISAPDPPAQRTLTIFGAYSCMDYTVDPKATGRTTSAASIRKHQSNSRDGRLEAMPLTNSKKMRTGGQRAPGRAPGHLENLRPQLVPPHLYVIGVDGKPTKDVHGTSKCASTTSTILAHRHWHIHQPCVSLQHSRCHVLRKAAMKPNKCDLLTKVFCTPGSPVCLRSGGDRAAYTRPAAMPPAWLTLDSSCR